VLDRVEHVNVTPDLLASILGEMRAAPVVTAR
jgi:hypothetical protein